MTGEPPFLRYGAPDAESLHGGPVDSGQQQVSIVDFVRRHLRGRFLLTGVLCGTLGLAAAAAGYLLPKPQYKVEGLVRVQASMPKILYQVEEPSQQPMVAAFANTQANLLQNPRVQARAMNSVGWRELSRPRTPESDEEFTKNLSVSTNKEAPELVFVNFMDPEPKAALVAVQEIIKAYQELFVGAEAKSVRDMQVSALASRKTTLEAQKRDFESRIRAVAAEFETSDLRLLNEHYVTQMLNFDTRISALAMMLGEAGIDPAALEAEAAAQGGAKMLAVAKTPDQIALSDRKMARLIFDYENTVRAIDQLRSTYADDHRVLQRVRTELEMLERAIDQRAREWMNPAVQANTMPVPIEAMTPPELANAYLRLREQTEGFRAKAMAISKSLLQSEELQREVFNTTALLDEVTKRIDQLALEAKVQDRIGRIDVILPDTPPSMPAKDPRVKFALFGLIAGFGLPFVTMLFIGFADRRFRYADQTADAGIPAAMLGVLPDLDEEEADAGRLAAAVHAVHHIRMRLRLGGEGRRTHVVSSPRSGDGKTTLALSLGISCSAAGARTLLVDFDLVGRALSNRLGASPAHGTGHAILHHRKAPEVVATAIPGLSLLPAGTADVRLRSRLTHEHFRQLLVSLREQYDVIIVDTGPVLGSLEANIAVAIADETLLVVGRGTRHGLVRDAATHVASIGGRLGGMVFNRASESDFGHSAAGSEALNSVRSGDPIPLRPATTPVPGMESADMLAKCVAAERMENEIAA
jgi:Mrp family chromosome partitioning ATPase/uncharacterized protein involved in exopolysaccharide biosynthesis